MDANKGRRVLDYWQEKTQLVVRQRIGQVVKINFYYHWIILINIGINLY